MRNPKSACHFLIANAMKLVYLIQKCTRKFNSFVGDSVKLFAIWKTSKIRSLFPLKDKNSHPCCVIYQGTCSCGAKYIGETERCVHIRISEHENPKKISEPSIHLEANPGHKFEWKVLCHAPVFSHKRKILEALHISKYRPCLNEQVKSTRLKLFPNGLT